MTLLYIAAIVFLINLPFGFWRNKTKRFSLQWILAVHIPVPFVIMLRFAGGLGWHFITFPVLIGAFFLGQYCGGNIVRFLHGTS